MDKEKILRILKRRLVKNLLLAAAIFFAIIFVTKFLLNTITKHGQELTVPDLTNITVAEASEIAEDMGLTIVVGDSVYIRRLGRGLVYTQTPPAGSKVKKGRRLVLTINAVTPKKVSVPNLVGYSLRQAKAELQTKGLAIGRLNYVKDIATNNVLRQKYRGSEIAPGTLVETLSKIDLDLGLNPDDNMTYIPRLVGSKYLRAVDMVHDYSLNVRRTIFDKTIKSYSDSLDAVVYRQSPEPSQYPIIMGGDVTLYLTLDPEKLTKE